jgi:S1-C subfamily serine protease
MSLFCFRTCKKFSLCLVQYHVIKGAADLTVTLLDQSVFPAKVVGFDEEKDIAVIKLQAGKEVIEVRKAEGGEGRRVGLERKPPPPPHSRNSRPP